MTNTTETPKQGRSTEGAPASRPGPKPDPAKKRSRYNEETRAKPVSRKNVRMVLGGECRNGHPLTEDNIFYESRGYMRCRVCLSNGRRQPGIPEKTAVPRRGTGICGRGHEFDGRECKRCRRERDLERKYGMTAEQYDALMEAQAEACAICGISFTTIPARRMHVDHNHVTGLVRGFLCHGCNTGLGSFQDDEVLLKRAIEYLGAKL